LRQLRYSIFTIVATLTVLSTSIGGAARAAALSASATCARCDADIATVTAHLLREINAERQANGLHVLAVSPALAEAAGYHDRQMLEHGFFGHDSPDGATFWQRVTRFYPPKTGRYWAVGENLLRASPGAAAETMLRSWLASAPHRRVLLDPSWRNIGLAIRHVSTAGGVYGWRPVTVVTADFGVR
jgi:uncharacterized protein YkwD